MKRPCGNSTTALRTISALEPLRRDDVGVYLMFRLRAAGYHGPDLFTKGAIQRISETSEGLTRRINILADKALLAAFSDGVHQIDCRQARAAIRDAQFKPLSRRFGSRWVWIGGAAVAAGAIASAAYLAGEADEPIDAAMALDKPWETTMKGKRGAQGTVRHKGPYVANNRLVADYYAERSQEKREPQKDRNAA